MPENELAALTIDIETHGQREVGVLLDGKVLDGWHRYLACSKAGAEFKSKDFEGEDPVAFVISRNLHRRHLTVSQRASSVVKCTEWRQNGVNSRAATLQGMTSAAMAKQADVSERTIVEAKRAEEIGLGDEVRDGKVTAHAASEVSKLSPAKQAKAVKAIKEGKAQERKPKVVAADPKFEKLYGEVKDELTATKESLADLADLAASAKAFEEKQEFKEMQVLRLELRSCKRRRDELMAENAQLKSEVKRWRKKAEAK